MNRRNFLRAAAVILAAPAIIRVAALMPIKPVPRLRLWPPPEGIDNVMPDAEDYRRIRELRRLNQLLKGQVLPIDLGGGSWVTEHPAPGR